MNRVLPLIGKVNNLNYNLTTLCLTLPEPLSSSDFMGDLSAFHKRDCRIGRADRAGDEDKMPQGLHTFGKNI